MAYVLAGIVFSISVIYAALVCLANSMSSAPLVTISYKPSIVGVIMSIVVLIVHHYRG